MLDNASTDDTPMVLSSIKDKRMQVIRHEHNLGCFGNWNYALDHATTEYLVIFHDDDRMFPWMLESLVQAMEANLAAGLAGCSVSSNFILGSGPLPNRDNGKGTFYDRMQLVNETAKKRGNRVVCPSVIYRKSIINGKDMRFRPDAGAAADMLFWLEANSKGVPVFLMDSPLLEYRIHEHSGTNQLDATKWEYTYSKVALFLRSLSSDVNFNGLMEWFAASVIDSAISAMGDQVDLVAIKQLRSSLREKHDWIIADKLFNKIIAKHYIFASLNRYERAQIGFFEMIKRTFTLGGLDAHVALSRRTSWVVKGFLRMGKKGAEK